jgi:magnesium-protoporphyrin O-methyltransferase
MFKLGISKSVSVDASSAYLVFARQEAERVGTADRVTFLHGNFVEVAPKLEPADIVTLDRVICCYDDMPSLVSSSAALTKKFYGVVFPIENWLVEAAVMIGNFFLWLSRNPFRIFAHPTKEVEEIVLAEGLHRIFYKRVGFWQVIVFGR